MQWLSISLFFCLSCGVQPEEPELTDLNDTCESPIFNQINDTSALSNVWPENCEMISTTYEFNPETNDSSVLCTEYLFIDQNTNKVGKCYYRLPFEIEAISISSFDQLKEKYRIETFDPQICEVGGHSAYNKYELKKNDSIHFEILHYKAWYEDYTEEGEPITNDIPEYFVGEKIKIIHSEFYLNLSSFDEEGEFIESIENYYNENGVLIRQKWTTYANKVFLAHYYYSF